LWDSLPGNISSIVPKFGYGQDVRPSQHSLLIAQVQLSGEGGPQRPDRRSTGGVGSFGNSISDIIPTDQPTLKVIVKGRKKCLKPPTSL